MSSHGTSDPRGASEVAAGRLLRARPWDVVGAALGAPMIVWGLLTWFGTAGDAGGDVPGYFSGGGAAGIGLVLAASAFALNQILAGRPHEQFAPPVQVFLSGAGSIVVLGAMIAKPDSTTLEAGSLIGLVTALGQTASLTVGWLRGSGKTVLAAQVQALHAQQAVAEQAARVQANAGYPNYQQYAPQQQYPSYPLQAYPNQHTDPNQAPQYGQPYGQQPYGQPPPYGQASPFDQPPYHPTDGYPPAP